MNFKYNSKGKTIEGQKTNFSTCTQFVINRIVVYNFMLNTKLGWVMRLNHKLYSTVFLTMTVIELVTKCELLCHTYVWFNNYKKKLDMNNNVE